MDRKQRVVCQSVRPAQPVRMLSQGEEKDGCSALFIPGTEWEALEEAGQG